MQAVDTLMQADPVIRVINVGKQFLPADHFVINQQNHAVSPFLYYPVNKCRSLYADQARPRALSHRQDQAAVQPAVISRFHQIYAESIQNTCTVISVDPTQILSPSKMRTRPRILLLFSPCMSTVPLVE